MEEHLYCKWCKTEKPITEFRPRTSKSQCYECSKASRREIWAAARSPEAARALWERRQAEKRWEPRCSMVERAYTAGLIDGEGCIRVTLRGAQGGRVFRPGQHTLVVQVNNTDRAMVAWLAERWGGSLSYRSGDVATNRKAQWAWQLQANNALAMLDEILPYLITKRRQAVLGRRFQRYVQMTGRARTPKVGKVQHRFYNELRHLNRRGLIQQE